MIVAHSTRHGDAVEHSVSTGRDVAHRAVSFEIRLASGAVAAWRLGVAPVLELARDTCLTRSVQGIKTVPSVTRARRAAGLGVGLPRGTELTRGGAGRGVRAYVAVITHALAGGACFLPRRADLAPCAGVPRRSCLVYFAVLAGRTLNAHMIICVLWGHSVTVTLPADAECPGSTVIETITRRRACLAIIRMISRGPEHTGFTSCAWFVAGAIFFEPPCALHARALENAVAGVAHAVVGARGRSCRRPRARPTRRALAPAPRVLVRAGRTRRARRPGVARVAAVAEARVHAQRPGLRPGAGRTRRARAGARPEFALATLRA